MITPDIPFFFPLLDGTNGIFPTVHITQTISMDKAPTGETDKRGFHISQLLSKISTQSIRTVLKGLFRKKGNYVDGKLTFGGCQDDQTGCVAVLCRFQAGSICAVSYTHLTLPTKRIV